PSPHAAARYTKIVGDLDFQALAGRASDGHPAQRFLYREESEGHESQSDSFLTTDFATGKVSHRIVAGVEAGYSTTDSRIGTAPAPSLDIDAPVYGPRPADPPLAPTEFDTPRFGVYVQDQARVGSKLTVVPA